MDSLPSQYSNQRAEIDTSRPFRSVKEAVALFGQRFLVGEVYTEKPAFSGIGKPMPIKFDSPTNELDLGRSLKRLEAELDETKLEVKHLKERELATEMAIASLNHEFRKSISKVAIDEASAVALAVRTERSADHAFDGDGKKIEVHAGANVYKKRQSLAELLSMCEEEEEGNDTEWRQQSRKLMKKQPIMPLVSDMFHRKKRMSRQG